MLKEDSDGEPEPDQETDGPATVLDFVPPKQVIMRASCVAKALGFGLLLMTTVPGIPYANQTPAMTRPLPTAEAPACCRICRKGQPCGDACTSSTKQCKKEQGCACSAAGDS